MVYLTEYHLLNVENSVRELEANCFLYVLCFFFYYQVGTGFSFTDGKGYATNEDDVERDLYR